jgi:hypothetical protein
MCDYCGVMWQRSKLFRDEAGLLCCPDEGDGKTGTELSRLNAESAREFRAPTSHSDGGHYVKTNVDADGNVDESVYVQRTTLDDL